jgi:hypothetical protein
MNFGITAAYAPCGSWRFPKTLKYLRPYVSSPYRDAYSLPYSSQVRLVTAYGESRLPSRPSDFGSSGESP